MENEVITCIKGRRSVRSYTDIAITKENVDTIITAGKYAPSAENRQPWKFIIISDKKTIDDLSKEVKQQIHNVMAHRRKWKRRFPEASNNETAFFLNTIASSQQDIIFFNAPLIILIITDNLVFNDESCAAAAQNMMIAAWSLGIGSCWIGFAKFLELNIDVMHRLGVPEGYHISACIVFGYAEHVSKASLRKPTADIIRWIE